MTTEYQMTLGKSFKIDAQRRSLPVFNRWKAARRALITEGHLVEVPIGRMTPADRARVRERLELEAMAAPYGGPAAMFETWNSECETAVGPMSAADMIAFLGACSEMFDAHDGSDEGTNS